MIPVTIASPAAAAGVTTDRVDSWIEVASQPSDSYTSSSSPEDPVVLSGLHLPPGASAAIKRKRSGRRRNSTSTAIPGGRIQIESSSEDEDEDEDDDIDNIDVNALDSIGSSITDDPSLSSGEEESDDEAEDDEDEEEEGMGGAGYPQYAGHPMYGQQQRPLNFRTFSREPPQPDHDAALRASLSTLLSCAAGVRGLSKPKSGTHETAHRPPAPIQTLSLVTDSEREAMMAAPMPAMNTSMQQHQQHQQQATGMQLPPQHPHNQAYRRSTVHNPPPQSPHPLQQMHNASQITSQRKVKEDHAVKHKKARTRRASKTTQSTASSTVVPATNIPYITLAVSAGAVILVSAISFSAGYALGKEVGRTEVLEIGSAAGGDIVKRAASKTVGKVGGRVLMSSGNGLRSITVV